MTGAPQLGQADMDEERLRAVLAEMAEATRRMLTERDLRFQQRFEAQAEAISMARTAAEEAAAVARSTYVVKETAASLTAQVAGQRELTEAKFVTFRTLIDSQADKVALALAASKEAINKAEAAAEKARDRLADEMTQRFESVNEFRGQQKDVISTFMPRSEMESRLTALIEKIDTMTELRLTDMKLVREQVVIADSRLENRLQELERAASNMQGRLWALGVGIAAIVIVVNVALRFVT